MADLDHGRPLDPVGSIKIKIGLLVALSILTAALVLQIGNQAGVAAWLTLPVTVAAALGVTQWLARGMTAPLREMTSAAGRMARGDHSVRVTATSADEVGHLGRAFNTMAEDLATADQQRRQLVATVSHELRTPLAGQRALLENLVDGVVTPDDAALQAALTQSERLSQLVEDLLDVTRTDRRSVSLRLEPVRVVDLLRRAVEEAEVGGRSVRYEVTVNPEDLEVRVDEARLHQVVANLLDNASRHSPTGGLVALQAAALPGEGRRVGVGVNDAQTAVEQGFWSLEISDQGPGLSAERAESLLTRFGAGESAGGNTGLGLAIAGWACELHGGTIAALSPPKGTTGARIRAVLPIDPQPSEGTRSVWKQTETELIGAQADMKQADMKQADMKPTDTEPTDTEPTDTEPTDKERSGVTKNGTRPSSETTSAAPSSDATSVAVPQMAPSVASTASVIESMFDGLWPERTSLRTAPLALFGSLAVGLLGALILPDRLFGLGTFLVLLAAGVLVLSRSIHRSRPWTVFSAVLCLGLGSLVLLRDAEWLAVLAVLAAGVLVSVALTDARRPLAMVAGAVSWVLSGLRGLPLLRRTLTATSQHHVLWPALRTTAVSLVLLVVFVGLFASGDALFGNWVASIVPEIRIADTFVLRAFTWFLVCGVVLAGCYLALNPPRVEQVGLGEPRPVARPWEWQVPVGVVIVVFAAFLVAQATAMWGGHHYLQRTTGLTYAEYVHQGFGQLVVATVLTLLTIAVAVRKAPRRTARDRLVLRFLLGALCLLTLIVVGSALYRMSLYQEAYGYTVLRVLVDAFEVWLGVLVVLVMVAGIRLGGDWLPRTAVATGAVFLLVIGLANPEAWVAAQNIARFEQTGKLDLDYLSSLGPDAAPIIKAGLPPHVAECALSRQDSPTDDILEWNLGRERAAAVAASAEAETSNGPANCPHTVGE